ncbi:MAG: hypothetical protein R8K46_08220 [Mariprofundaceae bacterium]
MKDITKIFAGTLVFMALSVGAAVADDGGRSYKHSDDHGKMLKHADMNDDGIVTQDEFISHAMKRFVKKDRNGDGVLDKRDHKEHHSFDDLDKDGDGVISRGEFEQAHPEKHHGKHHD